MFLTTLTGNIAELAVQIQDLSEQRKYDAAQLVLVSLEKDVRKLRSHIDHLQLHVELQYPLEGGD